jgi:hypothetical protein
MITGCIHCFLAVSVLSILQGTRQEHVGNMQSFVAQN